MVRIGIRMTIPPVSPPSTDPDRPVWSIMIPTWRPDPTRLRAALESVLAQTRTGGRFQVTVVDDASPGWVGLPQLGAVAAGVTLERNAHRLGIAGNWNRCLELARGHLVHLLHQDDFVRDGFYARIEAGLTAHPEAGAAFVQPSYVDSTGRELQRGAQVSARSGLLHDWVEHVFVQLRFACAGIVVRRSVYERLGGYDTRLRYTLDWDMWQRIAVSTPIWYEPERLACCRLHGSSATNRLLRSGRNLREIAWSIERGQAYLGPEAGPATARRARAAYMQWAYRGARELLRQGRWLAGLGQLWGLRHLRWPDPRPP
jgi:glycosyltransferase involved in cell wall biosynthesis